MRAACWLCPRDRQLRPAWVAPQPINRPVLRKCGGLRTPPHSFFPHTHSRMNHASYSCTRIRFMQYVIPSFLLSLGYLCPARRGEGSRCVGWQDAYSLDMSFFPVYLWFISLSQLWFSYLGMVLFRRYSINIAKNVPAKRWQYLTQRHPNNINWSTTLQDKQGCRRKYCIMYRCTKHNKFSFSQHDIIKKCTILIIQNKTQHIIVPKTLHHTYHDALA